MEFRKYLKLSNTETTNERTGGIMVRTAMGPSVLTRSQKRGTTEANPESRSRTRGRRTKERQSLFLARRHCP